MTVVNAELFQMRKSIEKIGRARSDMAAGGGDLVGDLFIAQPTGVATAMPVHDKGERRPVPACVCARETPGVIAKPNLPAPPPPGFFLLPGGDDPIHHASARAA